MIRTNKFFKTFFDTIKNMDKKIKHIIERGFLFSNFICLIGIILLVLHIHFFITFEMIEAAIILFKTSIFFAVQFLICGFAFDKILKMQ